MQVLITGGAGYIGSTVGWACLDAGHSVVVLDDFSMGRREFVPQSKVYQGDIADADLLRRIIAENEIDAVIHCAAKILVPESVDIPLDYYANNVSKTIEMVKVLTECNLNRLIFSSSGSIYAPDEHFQVTEESPLHPESPYARTKMMIEMILEDAVAASDLHVLSLRYFNPIGTDPQMRSGQQIRYPSHVIWKMLDAVEHDRDFVITGVDWPTRDGSGIRDYIHIWDLAQAHVAALEHFDEATADAPYQVINIGTGRGTTVKELVSAFEEATGYTLSVTTGPARLGDVAGVYGVSTKAADLLHWRTQLSDADAIRSAMRWLPVRMEMLGY